MAKAFNQRFKIERNESLIFDDQHVGGDFRSKFTAGIFHQLTQCRHVDVQNLCRFIFGKAFQSHQQERLPGHRRDLRQMALDWRVDVCDRRLAVQADRIPDLREQPVEADPRRGITVHDRGVLDQGLQSGRYIGVTRSLACQSKRGRSGADKADVVQLIEMSTRIPPETKIALNLAGMTPISPNELTPGNAAFLEKSSAIRGTICQVMGFESTPDGGTWSDLGQGSWGTTTHE